MPKEMKIVIPVLALVAIVGMGGTVWSFMGREALFARIEEYGNKTRVAETESAVLREKLVSARKEQNIVDQELTRLLEQIEVVSVDRDELRERVTTMEQSRLGLLDRLRALSEDQSIIRPVMAAMPELSMYEGQPDRALLAQLLREKAELEVKVNILAEEVHQANGLMQESQDTAQALRGELGDLQRTKEAIEDELSKGDEVALRLTDQYLDERNQRLALDEEARQLRENSTALDDEVAELSKELGELRSRYDQANRERLALSQELTAMSEVLDDRQSELSRVRAVLEKLTGRVGMGASVSTVNATGSIGQDAVSLPPIVVQSGTPYGSTGSYSTYQAPSTTAPSYGSPYGSTPTEYGNFVSSEPPAYTPSTSSTTGYSMPGAMNGSRSMVSTSMYAPAPIESMSPSMGTDTPAYGGSSMMGGLRGEVLTVNEEHNFVVINLGSRDGVVEGARFEIMRDGKTIGELKVIEARQAISAADIMRISATAKGFQKGDEAVQVTR